MKKVILFIGFILMSAVAYSLPPEFLQRNNVILNYKTGLISSTTNLILIDKSDTSNYKHINMGHIAISSIRVDVDKALNSTGSVKIGLLNHVNDSTGTVSYFFECVFSQTNTRTTQCYQRYHPSVLRAKAIRNVNQDGDMPYIITNDSDTGDTTFQSDVNLTTSLGDNVAPQIGDIIIKLENGSSANFDANIEILYFGDK